MRFRFLDLRLSLLAALMCAACLAPSFARASGRARTIPSDSTVEITLTPWVEDLPRAGMLPVTVNIANRSAHDHTWEFTSHENRYGAGGMSGHFEISVPAGGTASGTFLINTLPESDPEGRDYKNVVINVAGPGVVMGGNVYLNATASRRSGGPVRAVLSPYVALSEQFDRSYGTTFKSTLDSQMHLQWLGDTVTMAQAPLDWRGYTGFNGLWMMDGEWSALSEAQRQALLTWVGTGGAVSIVAADATASKPALPEGLAWADHSLHYGLGSMSWVQGLVAEAAVTGVKNLRSSQSAWFAGGLSTLIPPLTLQGTLIFSFILVFGVVVGPLNLFWFARGANRPRLFWTTPLISFAGAAVLVAVMLLQDGTGGSGARVLLATLLPQQKQMVVVQEQFSKTGVLLGHAFDLPDHEATWLTPLHVAKRTGSGIRGEEEDMRENRSYELTGRHASGTWFASRAVQSQMLQSVRLNRGGIELKEGTAPSVVSSLGTPLARLYVMDGHQKLWTADQVAVGQRSTLKEASREEFEQWLEKTVKIHMGGLLRARLNASMPQEGPWFLAEASETAKIALPTLSSIRWIHDSAFVAGPAALETPSTR